MDNFSRNIILFIAGSLVFAFGLIFALRKFSKINITTRWKVASLFGFTGVTLLVYRMSDLMTLLKLIAYSIPFTCLACVLVSRFKDKLKKLPEGLYELIMGFLFLFLPWLHTTSFILEGILGFTAIFTGLFISFTYEEKYLQVPSR